MNEPERVDFRQVIADIEAAGISLHKIALLMHRQYLQVKRWKAGSEPKHHEGEMLLLIRSHFRR